MVVVTVNLKTILKMKKNIGKILKYTEYTINGEIRKSYKVKEIDIDAYYLYRESKKYQQYFDFDTFVTKHDVEITFFKCYYDQASILMRKEKLQKINTI